MSATPDVFDMDAARVERARVRAARREGRGDQQTIRFGGQPIAVIEAEFPLDVLEPFADVNLDLALLIRQAIDMRQADDQDTQLSNLDMIVSVLAANPHLPREVIDAVKQSGHRLLGETGYQALLEQRPTPWDVAALAKNLLAWYGVSLGEFSSPSGPSTDGATSKPISTPTSAASTPDAIGDGQTTLNSEEFATSSPGSPGSPTTP